MANETTDASFQKDVLESDKPVLVDFWAEWCGPCKILGPVIDELAGEVGDDAKVYKLNVDHNQATAQKYGITAIPTVIVFKNGQVHNQIVGVQPKQNYKTALVN